MVATRRAAATPVAITASLGKLAFLNLMIFKVPPEESGVS
jgi:hypothetical protein